MFIIPSTKGGGQEKVARMVSNYLQQFHNVTVVCFEQGIGNPDFKTAIVNLNVLIKNGVIGKALALLNRVRALRKLKNKLHPDITIGFGDTACILNYFTFSPEKKIGTVMQSFIRPTANNGFFLRVHKKIYKHALKNATHSLANCRELLQQLKKNKINKSSFIYTAVDIEEQQLLSQQALPAAAASFFNAFTIAHTARIDPSKCHWQLIDIFCMAKKQLPSLKLLLIAATNEQDPFKNKIFKYCIDKLTEEGHQICFATNDLTAAAASSADVMIALQCTNPIPFLNRAAAFVFPSAWEGFPNALLEAMLAGLPVISSNCATGPTELLNGKNSLTPAGILLPAFSLPFGRHNEDEKKLQLQWSQSIVDLLSSKDLQQQYTARSAIRVQDFTAEKILPEWKEIIGHI